MDIELENQQTTKVVEEAVKKTTDASKEFLGFIQTYQKEILIGSAAFLLGYSLLKK